ncbi:IKI3 family-domain-containing protein [Dipodascopsis uninucleata]
MRNLQQTQRSRFSVSAISVPPTGRGGLGDDTANDEDLILSSSFFDPVSDSLICSFGPTGQNHNIEIQEIKKSGKVNILAAWEARPLDESMVADRVVDLHFFPDEQQVIVVLAGGDIVSVQITSDDDDEPEGMVSIVGSIDDGVMAASWSPDEELLVLVTGSSPNSAVFLNRSLDLIAERHLDQEDISVVRQVNVGWGKKETQFEGKGVKGARARDPTLPTQISIGILSSLDDGKIRLSWRGDGQFIAVNTIDPIHSDDTEDQKNMRRVIRVLTRDGNLDSVSEALDGLESFVAWRPSGNLIAGVQRNERLGIFQVVFFERNGLRRGEFSLPIDINTPILQLEWNVESSLLAVVTDSRVLLWSTGNYHWYLKQELIPEQHITLSRWHPERSLKYLICSKSVIEVHEFNWALFSGSCDSPHDRGLVAVVDGTNVKLTPLAIANVPPPMAFREFTVDTTPIHIAVNIKNEIFAVLNHSSIVLAVWDITSAAHTQPPSIQSKIEISSLISHSTVTKFATFPRLVCFVGNDNLAVVVDQGIHSRLLILHLEPQNGFEYDISFTDELSPGITCITSRTDQKALIVEQADGTVREYEMENYRKSLLTSLPERCLSIGASRIVDEDGLGKTITFGLAASGRLYANSRRLAVACTSYVVMENYVVLTTTQNLLKFIHLTADPDKLDVPDDAVVSIDERCRNVERGAKLVSVIPSKVAVVLQMPRGNLETIYPRLLVLEGIRRAIDNKDYLQAFKSCRAHRVNLDILYDYAPDLFMKNIKLFVESLEKVEYLDLFLSGLTNDDVTRTIYRETIKATKLSSTIIDSTDQSTIAPDKVNNICDAVLDVLMKYHARSHVQSIITACLCKSPPDITAALNLVSSFGSQDQDKVNPAIEHICFLQDVNKLYDHALGMYDLRLALLIARNSQKDPREYLTFLESMQKKSPIRRRYLLDTHLGRFSKALTHLCELKYDEEGNDIFPEVEAFVIKHNLYKDALNIYKYEPVKQYAIFRLYADHLKSLNEYKEAGLAYEMLGEYSNALECYILGSCWQEALATCKLVHLDNKDEMEVAVKLGDALSEARRYYDAAVVYLQYCKDTKEAIRTLCKGFLFNEAIRIALLEDISQASAGEAVISSAKIYLEEFIDPALIEGFNQISELLSDCRGQFTSQMIRLRELRKRKTEDPMSYFEGQEDPNIPDNVSLAPSEMSTAASFFTRYTGKTGGTAHTGVSRKTSKNRRREERKRARGKKGSIYEEEYLVNSIRRMIERLHDTKQDARQLVEGLLRRTMRERAIEIQRGYINILDSLSREVNEVFTVSEKDRERMDDDGNIYLLPEQSIPVVSEFEKLSILDF